jgi:hypothetical protein
MQDLKEILAEIKDKPINRAAVFIMTPRNWIRAI